MLRCGFAYKGRVAEKRVIGDVECYVWYEPTDCDYHRAASVLEMRAYIDGLRR
jgi:hypothetical protein